MRSSNDRWVAFDLDDTLHDFTSASRAASEAVFARLVARRAGLALEELRQTYGAVCRAYVGAFVDGRTSAAYRRERMEALLRRSGVPIDEAAACVRVYARTLDRSLRPEPGAAAALATLRERGYRLAVVSEGPHDAQERALRRLGMHDRIDLLVTSNRERLSKRDGLYARFARLAGAAPSACTVVGDSLAADVCPALAAGMRAIRYDPRGLGAEDPQIVRVARLADVPDRCADRDSA